MAAVHARGNPIPPSGPQSGSSVPGGTGGGATGRDGSVAQQRLQGAFLTVIGLAGAFGGVLFSIEAPRLTPVPVVFLTFWLVMVIAGQILFAGLRKLRAAGVNAPAPGQVRAAAAVAAIVVAVGLTGLATTTAGVGSAVAAPCPGGGPATCGPTPGPGPELTFTPPAQQAAPGQQPGQQGPQQDNNGIATSPAGSGGNNGGNIQAQTPDFGTPGQPRPNIPGNEQPGQGQQPGQQQGPVRTTSPGGPQQQTSQQQPGQQTGQASPSQPTVTVTQTQSQCPAPGAPGTPGTPGAGGDSGSGGAGPDGGGSDDGAPSWAYLVGEASALLTGRRRPGSGGGAAPQPATRTFDQIIDPTTSSDSSGGSEAVEGGLREVAWKRTSQSSGEPRC
ncbi:hypothetical protein GCM10009581_14200 [Tsukamurella strandjordii]